MKDARGPVIAIPIGDAAGIGPEIAVKAAAADAVKTRCRPILIGDAGVIARAAALCGIDAAALDIVSPNEAALPGDIAPGVADGAVGRATLEAASAAVAMALRGEAHAVVAAPHNQTAIRRAGIDDFDGYPGFVGSATGADPEGVFLMLVDDDRRIVHATLHQSVREALAAIDSALVGRALRAADAALRAMGIAAPRIGVSGVNPHAGEGGLFGCEEIEHIAPAIAAAQAEGIDAAGPFGADTLYLDRGFDAYLVMLHDQGHIPAKLSARNPAAVTIGTPVMFATVAHGSAYDIAWQGKADASCLIATVLRFCDAR
jgi:4-hydroxy-L-threonine phosphate dehydrogenase PdxA